MDFFFTEKGSIKKKNSSIGIVQGVEGELEGGGGRINPKFDIYC